MSLRQVLVPPPSAHADRQICGWVVAPRRAFRSLIGRTALNIGSIAEAVAASINDDDIEPGDDPVPEPVVDELAEPAGPYCWRFANGTVAANVPLHSTRSDLILRPYPETNPRLRNLDVKGKRRPDEFYRQVAAVFTHARAVEGRPGPAQRIADANKVPVTTVHRWTKEARRRGLFDLSQAAEQLETITEEIREGFREALDDARTTDTRERKP